MTSNFVKLESKLCSLCESVNDTTANGFIVCTNCGTTKDRAYVDAQPQYVKDGSLAHQSSIGKNIDFVGALGSQIGYNSGLLSGLRGQRLSSKTQNKYKRLIKLHHNRVRIEGNATHLRTMIAFTRVFNSLNITKDIKNRALHYYWKYVRLEKKITNHVLLIALCFLQSIRESKDKAPIRFSEIIRAFANNGHRVTNKNILRLARELNISLNQSRRRAEDYISRIAAQVRNSEEILQRLEYRVLEPEQYEMLLIHISAKFLSRLDRHHRGGVQPYPFAVSVVYLADRALSKVLKRKAILTQKILAKAANSAEFTIRDHVYRFLGEMYKKNENYLINETISHLSQGDHT